MLDGERCIELQRSVGYIVIDSDDKVILWSGPIKFVEWVKDDRVTLTANKDWWGPKADFEKI